MNDPLYQAQMKQSQEGGAENLQNPSSALFHYAAAVFCLKKFIEEFTGRSQTRAASLNRQKALEDLAAFKAVLEELATYDKSHDPEFTQRLSILWQNLYENCQGLEDQVELVDTVSSQILRFILEIKNFPPGEDHTLGYYLAEHAGQDWIPFPFMNLLASLHEEYQNSLETSKLAAWIEELGNMIE